MGSPISSKSSEIEPIVSSISTEFSFIPGTCTKFRQCLHQLMCKFFICDHNNNFPFFYFGTDIIISKGCAAVNLFRYRICWNTSLVRKLIQQITVYNDHFTIQFKSGLDIDINENKSRPAQGSTSPSGLLSFLFSNIQSRVTTYPISNREPCPSERRFR